MVKQSLFFLDLPYSATYLFALEWSLLDSLIGLVEDVVESHYLHRYLFSFVLHLLDKLEWSMSIAIQVRVSLLIESLQSLVDCFILSIVIPTWSSNDSTYVNVIAWTPCTLSMNINLAIFIRAFYTDALLFLTNEANIIELSLFYLVQFDSWSAGVADFVNKTSAAEMSPCIMSFSKMFFW